jgi:hypothetical protein
MALTTDQIETWVTGHVWQSNGETSSEILKSIVSKLPEHSFTYGPTDNNGYTLEISGPTINQTFVVKADV